MKYNPKTKAILWIAISVSIFLWFNYLSYISLVELFKSSDIGEAIISLLIVIFISVILGFIILLIIDKLLSYFAPEKKVKISKQKKYKPSDVSLAYFIKDLPAIVIICFLVGFFNFAIVIGAPLLLIDYIFGLNLLEIFLALFKFENGNFFMNAIKISILGIPQVYKYGSERNWRI